MVVEVRSILGGRQYSAVIDEDLTVTSPEPAYEEYIKAITIMGMAFVYPSPSIPSLAYYMANLVVEVDPTAEVHMLEPNPPSPAGEVIY